MTSEEPVLVVPAGAGGDFLGALLVIRSLGSIGRPCIATPIWERPILDPFPGPRSAENLSNLELLDDKVLRITPRVSLPGGYSPLPWLASVVPYPTLFLDLAKGVPYVRDQILAIYNYFSCRRLLIVDVGGDLGARGKEPGLRSPLSDAIVLAAVGLSELAGNVIVVGAGLDGELSPTEWAELVHEPYVQPCGQITQEAAQEIYNEFSHMPWETTLMLCLAATGTRGSVEIAQDVLVSLDPSNSITWCAPILELLDRNRIAGTIAETLSLAEAESVVTSFGHDSEIVRERNFHHLTGNRNFSPDLSSLTEYSNTLRQAGVDFMSFRRIQKFFNVASLREARVLQKKLTNSFGGHLRPPLWELRD